MPENLEGIKSDTIEHNESERQLNEMLADIEHGCLTLDSVTASINGGFFVEVEKGGDWQTGFLNWKGDVVKEMRDAEEFENIEDAADAATMFNIEYGRGGRIYARVR